MRDMKKVAIIVQRFGTEVVGGSEGYAFKMAEAMSTLADVEVLTTTAKDHVTWKNHYPEGAEVLSETLRIRRFALVDAFQLQHAMLQVFVRPDTPPDGLAACPAGHCTGPAAV